MRVVVLGAGVIGITTAYILAKNGHDVTVIERNSESAAECSFANGGQLSYSHAEPWANPDLLPKIPKWIFASDSPLVFRPRFEPKMWVWISSFLRHCTKRKADEGTRNTLRLALYSRKILHGINDEADIDFNFTQKGILHVFKSHATLRNAHEHAKFQKDLGCDFEFLPDRASCEAKEPALKTSPKKIVGGLYFPMDESGDVHEFTQGLSRILVDDLGAKILYDTHLESIETSADQVTGILTSNGLIEADQYVVSLGAYSTQHLRNIGIHVPIYPMKGYSLSIPVSNDDETPEVSFTDQGNKIVYSRLGNRLRIAGTAEFAGYNHDIIPSRIRALKRMVKCLFPNCGDFDQASEWACLRPSTPDGLPILGKTPFANLILNTGHGTLGWTLSCGSAQIIADLVENKTPKIDLTGLTLERYKGIC